MTTESTRSDSLIERTESVADEKGAGREMQAANLFDLRRIIGGLFIAYGILMTILGITDSDAEIQKAAGVNINLWAGLGMLAFGALMMAWALWRPLGEQLREAEAEGDTSGAAAPDSHSDEGSRRIRRDTERVGRNGSAGSQ